MTCTAKVPEEHCFSTLKLAVGEKCLEESKIFFANYVISEKEMISLYCQLDQYI